MNGIAHDHTCSTYYKGGETLLRHLKEEGNMFGKKILATVSQRKLEVHKTKVNINIEDHSVRTVLFALPSAKHI